MAWLLVLLLIPLVASAPQAGMISSSYTDTPDMGTVPERLVVIAEDVNAPEEVVREAIAEILEENVNRVEKNGFLVEKSGDTVLVRRSEVNRPVSGEPPYAPKVREILEAFGVELNAYSGKRILVRERIGELNVTVVVSSRGNIAVGKKITVAPSGDAEVEIIVAVEENGLYVVKDHIDKGEGNVELNISGPYVVIDFDPVIAWVLEINGTERITYSVKNGYPREVEPVVSALATCDVEVKFLDVSYVKDFENEVFSGKFQVLLSDTPVYTPDIRVNGNYTFLRDGMFYIFEVNGSKVIIEGSVGDCRFYRELSSPTDYLPLVVLAVLALAVVAFFLLR